MTRKIDQAVLEEVWEGFLIPQQQVSQNTYFRNILHAALSLARVQ